MWRANVGAFWTKTSQGASLALTARASPMCLARRRASSTWDMVSGLSGRAWGRAPGGGPAVGWSCSVGGARAGFALGRCAALVAGFVAWLSFVRRRTEREQRLNPVAAHAA